MKKIEMNDKMITFLKITFLMIIPGGLLLAPIVIRSKK
jgi:hypothetical protein